MPSSPPSRGYQPVSNVDAAVPATNPGPQPRGFVGKTPGQPQPPLNNLNENKQQVSHDSNAFESLPTPSDPVSGHISPSPQISRSDLSDDEDVGKLKIKSTMMKELSTASTAGIKQAAETIADGIQDAADSMTSKGLTMFIDDQILTGILTLTTSMSIFIGITLFGTQVQCYTDINSSVDSNNSTSLVGFSDPASAYLTSWCASEHIYGGQFSLFLFFQSIILGLPLVIFYQIWGPSLSRHVDLIKDTIPTIKKSIDAKLRTLIAQMKSNVSMAGGLAPKDGCISADGRTAIAFDRGFYTFELTAEACGVESGGWATALRRCWGLELLLWIGVLVFWLKSGIAILNQIRIGGDLGRSAFLCSNIPTMMITTNETTLPSTIELICVYPPLPLLIYAWWINLVLLICYGLVATYYRQASAYFSPINPDGINPFNFDDLDLLYKACQNTYPEVMRVREKIDFDTNQSQIEGEVIYRHKSQGTYRLSMELKILDLIQRLALYPWIYSCFEHIGQELRASMSLPVNTDDHHFNFEAGADSLTGNERSLFEAYLVDPSDDGSVAVRIYQRHKDELPPLSPDDTIGKIFKDRQPTETFVKLLTNSDQELREMFYHQNPMNSGGLGRIPRLKLALRKLLNFMYPKAFSYRIMKLFGTKNLKNSDIVSDLDADKYEQLLNEIHEISFNMNATLKENYEHLRTLEQQRNEKREEAEKERQTAFLRNRSLLRSRRNSAICMMPTK